MPRQYKITLRHYKKLVKNPSSPYEVMWSVRLHTQHSNTYTYAVSLTMPLIMPWKIGFESPAKASWAPPIRCHWLASFSRKECIRGTNPSFYPCLQHPLWFPINIFNSIYAVNYNTTQLTTVNHTSQSLLFARFHYVQVVWNHAQALQNLLVIR